MDEKLMDDGRKIRNWHNKERKIVTGKRKTGHNGNYEPSLVV